VIKQKKAIIIAMQEYVENVKKDSKAETLYIKYDAESLNALRFSRFAKT
jgi:hypothetical protein